MMKNVAIVSLSSGIIGEPFVGFEVEIGLRRLQKYGLNVKFMPNACKGLEFDRVYLPALNEGIMPGRRCREPEDFEEERRLLYVAMTRARDHLELLYVTGTAENPRPPSRFLSVYGIRNFVSS